MVLKTYLALNSFEYFMWVVQGSISFVPRGLACRRRDFRVKFRVLKGFMSVFRSAQEAIHRNHPRWHGSNVLQLRSHD